MTQRQIYIVEDDEALRRTIRRMLESADNCITEFASAEKFLDGYSERPMGCVLLDIRLPGLNGIELLEQIADESPANPIIMISGFGDIPTAVRAMKVGAVDFLQKPFSKDQLAAVVEKAFGAIETSVSKSAEFDELTPREREVLIAFAQGAPNKIVAAQLGLSPRTVEMHRARMLQKLGASTTAEALEIGRTADLKAISPARN